MGNVLRVAVSHSLQSLPKDLLSFFLSEFSFLFQPLEEISALEITVCIKCYSVTRYVQS